MRMRKVPPRSGCLAFTGGGSPSAKLRPGGRPNLLTAAAAPPSLSKLRRDKGAVIRDAMIRSFSGPCHSCRDGERHVTEAESLDLCVGHCPRNAGHPNTRLLKET